MGKVILFRGVPRFPGGKKVLNQRQKLRVLFFIPDDGSRSRKDIAHLIRIDRRAGGNLRTAIKLCIDSLVDDRLIIETCRCKNNEPLMIETCYSLTPRGAMFKEYIREYSRDYGLQ